MNVMAVVALAGHVVVVAAVGQVFRLAHDSQLTLVWRFSLPPSCLAAPAATRRASASAASAAHASCRLSKTVLPRLPPARSPVRTL